MQAGFEREIRDDRCVHVGNTPARMLGEDVASTSLAPLPIAARRLAESADIICAPRDFHCVGLPQSEGVDGPCRPGSARLAMAIAHRSSLAADSELNRTAKTAAFVGLCMMRVIVRMNSFGSFHDAGPYLLTPATPIRWRSGR